MADLPGRPRCRAGPVCKSAVSSTADFLLAQAAWKTTKGQRAAYERCKGDPELSSQACAFAWAGVELELEVKWKVATTLKELGLEGLKTDTKLVVTRMVAEECKTSRVQMLSRQSGLSSLSEACVPDQTGAKPRLEVRPNARLQERSCGAAVVQRERLVRTSCSETRLVEVAAVARQVLA